MSVRGKRHNLGTIGAGSLAGLAFSIEAPQMLAAHDRRPLPSRFVPSNSTESRRRVTWYRPVLRISCARDCPQIGSAVIQTVSVDVIDFEAVPRNQSHQLAMHPDSVAPLAGDSGKATHRVAIVHGPPPPSDKVGVLCIDEGVRSDTSISCAERNANSPIGIRHDRGQRPQMVGITSRHRANSSVSRPRLVAQRGGTLRVAILPFGGR